MLKKNIFLLCCFLLKMQLSNAFASPFQPLYQRLLQVPVLAFVTVEKASIHTPPQPKPVKDKAGRTFLTGSLWGDGSTTTATLAINSVLKGVIPEKQINIKYTNNEGGTTVRYNIDLKKGEKKVLFLNKGDDKKWQLSGGSPYSLNVNAKNQIALDNTTNVSFSDFRAGVQFFEHNRDTKQIATLQKMFNNQTFCFLMKQQTADEQQYKK
jgi:hypothetical protein